MSSTSGTWDSPDDAIARVAEQVEQAQERARRATQLREQMDTLRGTAKSPRAEVIVTSDVSGRFIGLELTDAALEMRPSDLARVILTTSQVAAMKAGKLAVELTADAFGKDSGITERMRQEIAERSPEAAAKESDIGYR